MANSTRPPARRGPSGAWNRLKPAQIDPLDVYTLPSKGETRLNDFQTQEKYYQKIVERYMKFCASSHASEGLEAAFASLSVKDTSPFSVVGNVAKTPTRPPLRHLPSDTVRTNDLPTILSAMRKLREGINQSRRTDHFAQRAYMFLIHASILAKSWEHYQPALLYLLYKIHPQTPLSTPELQEFTGYHILDMACRQNELTDAFALRLRFKHRDRRVNTVLQCLIHDDWVRFWRTKRAVDGYQRAIMEFAADRIRTHALKCLGAGYNMASKSYVERSGDASWEDLVKSGVGWQLQENGSVAIKKPRVKT